MSSLLLPVLLLATTMAAATAADSLSAVTPGCKGVCGGVQIPFPFGIGTNCSRSGFEIDCINNNSSAGEILVLANTDPAIRVLNLSVSPLPEALVLLPVAWQCFNSSGYVYANGSSRGGAVFNPEGVYRVSDTKNELYILGCNSLGYVTGGESTGGRFGYSSYTGCMAVAGMANETRDGACAGVGCCNVDIPPGITDTRMTFDGWPHTGLDFCPCDFGFVVDKGSYTFKTSDLLSTHIPNINQTTMPLVVDWTMPLRLDWAIRDNGSTSLSCSQAQTSTDPEYACRSHGECVNSTNGPGYFCRCAQGYQGNPYVVNVGGCTNIDECQQPELNSCPSGSKCIDTEGSYMCKCKFGRRGEDCHLIIPKRALIAIIATFAGIVLLALILWFVHLDRKRRMKAAFFDQNGGKILMGAAGINIFNEKQLEKMTNHYDTLIGKGAFGMVFKGTTDTKQLVAVKRSHNESMEIGKRGNLQQGDDIVNEITFQFANRHPNLVRLVGCCLETSIPVLVYEFISKGNLHNLLHNSVHQVLDLPTRLNIAIGSAQALAYLHSNGDRIHGDIKSANILLDENLQPKVSDFGSSKILSAGKYAMAVSADMSYIDPVYMKTERFVAKSDVYSFSVVLLELITRKTVKYGENRNNSLPVDFVKSFKETGNGRKMYDMDILSHNDGAQCQHCLECLDKIGALVVRCLKEDVDERPTMAEVVEELKAAAKVVDKCKQ